MKSTRTSLPAPELFNQEFVPALKTEEATIIRGPVEVILGNIPSKSNCYRIITIPGKGDPVECPDCDGSNDVNGPKCKTCGGLGVVDLPGDKHYSLGKTYKLKKYERDFALQCRHYKNKMIDSEFTIEVDVYYPTRRSDLDNSLKILLDCLQKVVRAIKNDNKCMRIVANKKHDPANPRIEFCISHDPTQKQTKTEKKPKHLF